MPLLPAYVQEITNISDLIAENVAGTDLENIAMSLEIIGDIS